VSNSKVSEEAPQLFGPRDCLVPIWVYGPWLSPSLIFMRKWRKNITYSVSNSLFYFYVYFEGSPPNRRTLGHRYAKGASPIVHVPTFPWKYFFSRGIYYVWHNAQVHMHYRNKDPCKVEPNSNNAHG
jgi:hypothetical protein